MNRNNARTETRAAILALVGGDATKAKVLVWCNGYERDADDLLSMLAGCNAGRDDLSDAEQAAVDAAYALVEGMVRDGYLAKYLDGVRFQYGPCEALRGRNTL